MKLVPQLAVAEEGLARPATRTGESVIGYRAVDREDRAFTDNAAVVVVYPPVMVFHWLLVEYSPTAGTAWLPS